MTEFHIPQRRSNSPGNANSGSLFIRIPQTIKYEETSL
jgi:hypothetical protein